MWDWLPSISGEQVSAFFGLAFQNQFFIWTTSLALAAKVHAGLVKKELGGVTNAINNLGAALRQDLAAVNERLSQVEKRVGSIEVSKTKNDGGK